jgi:integrase
MLPLHLQRFHLAKELDHDTTTTPHARGHADPELLGEPMPRKPQTLPIVLSPEEVRHFLSCVPRRKARTVLTVCYVAGLRVSEAIALKPTDIDGQRMTIRVTQGKGAKDRYVMLSEQLLQILRDWYRAARPKTWLFPGKIPGSHITRAGVEDGCELGVKRSDLSKPVTPHSLRHYFSWPTMSGLRAKTL